MALPVGHPTTPPPAAAPAPAQPPKPRYMKRHISRVDLDDNGDVSSARRRLAGLFDTVARLNDLDNNNR